MVLLTLIIFTLTFSELIVDLDATTCPKGQRVTKNGCENCPKNFYQPEANDSQRCKACRQCDGKSGSVIKKDCTIETNRICQCRGKFVPRDNDSSTCKCGVGFGLTNGECLKCGPGYFSTRINSHCQKWRECTAGESLKGTTTSDAICNEEPKRNTSVTITPAPTTVVSLITRLTSRRPQGGGQTQETHTTVPAHVSKRQPFHPSITGNHIGMAFLMFGVVALLVLTSVICKPHVTTCMEREPAVQKNDSLCRRPVEESGDGSMSSLKLNPEEP